MAKLFSKSSEKTPVSVLGKLEKDDFDFHKENIQKLERHSALLFKDSKKFLDAQTAVYKAEVKLSSDLSKDYSSNVSKNDLQNLSSEWFSRMSSLERTETSQTAAYLRESLKVKSKQYQCQFSPIHAEIRKRDQAFSEFLKMKGKVSKYQGSPRSGNNLVKLHAYQKQLEEAQCKFEEIDTFLKSRLPEFYDSRFSYFQPLMESLTNGSIQDAVERNMLYRELSASPSMTDEEYNKLLKSKLSAVSKLTIVRDQQL